MRPFKSTPPNRLLLSFSGMHIMLICMVLLAVQEYPYRPRKTVYKLNLPALKHPAKPGMVFNMEDYMQKWKREERRFTQFKLTGDADFDGLTLCAIEYETRKLRSEMIQHAL